MWIITDLQYPWSFEMKNRFLRFKNRCRRPLTAIPAACVVLPLAKIVRLFVTFPIVHLEGALSKPQMHTLLDSRSVWLSCRPGGVRQSQSVSYRHKLMRCDKIISWNPEPSICVMAPTDQIVRYIFHFFPRFDKSQIPAIATTQMSCIKPCDLC